MNDKHLIPSERRQKESDRRNESSAILQDRRHGGERRKLIYGVEFTTGGPLESVEEWLDENCRGEWSVVLVGMDDDLVRKTIRIMFENKSDKEVFKDSAAQF